MLFIMYIDKYFWILKVKPMFGFLIVFDKGIAEIP